MAFAARLTEESIIRAKHAPLGWVSPIQVVYIDEGLVQCLVDVGGFQGRDATCMLRMLTSRRCAQAHANGSKHPVHNQCLPLYRISRVFTESGCLGIQPKVRGKLLVKLNIAARPIANK
jgi:hypothetical protein